MLEIENPQKNIVKCWGPSLLCKGGLVIKKIPNVLFTSIVNIMLLYGSIKNSQSKQSILPSVFIFNLA